MKAYTIEIYDESINKRMRTLKEQTGKSYADQMRAGLRLLFTELEQELQNKSEKTAKETIS